MRRAAVVLALLLPATLPAQFPAPGSYDVVAVQAGGTQQFKLFMNVAQQGDSVVLTFGQSPEQPIQINEQEVIADGFVIKFFNSRCPFVRIEDRWEAVCANPFDVPQFHMTLTRKAEPTPA